MITYLENESRRRNPTVQHCDVDDTNGMVCVQMRRRGLDVHWKNRAWQSSHSVGQSLQQPDGSRFSDGCRASYWWSDVTDDEFATLCNFSRQRFGGTYCFSHFETRQSNREQRSKYRPPGIGTYADIIYVYRNPLAHNGLQQLRHDSPGNETAAARRP